MNQRNPQHLFETLRSKDRHEIPIEVRLCMSKKKIPTPSITESKVFDILRVLSVQIMAVCPRNNQTFLFLMVITFVMIPLCYSTLPQSDLEQHHAFARCPNGTHKSPSGACEQVVPHEGLPRCPNGFHRSPSA